MSPLVNLVLSIIAYPVWILLPALPVVPFYLVYLLIRRGY